MKQKLFLILIAIFYLINCNAQDKSKIIYKSSQKSLNSELVSYDDDQMFYSEDLIISKNKIQTKLIIMISCPTNGIMSRDNFAYFCGIISNGIINDYNLGVGEFKVVAYTTIDGNPDESYLGIFNKNGLEVKFNDKSGQQNESLILWEDLLINKQE